MRYKHLAGWFSVMCLNGCSYGGGASNGDGFDTGEQQPDDTFEVDSGVPETDDDSDGCLDTSPSIQGWVEGADTDWYVSARSSSYDGIAYQARVGVDGTWELKELMRSEYVIKAVDPDGGSYWDSRDGGSYRPEACYGMGMNVVLGACAVKGLDLTAPYCEPTD